LNFKELVGVLGVMNVDTSTLSQYSGNQVSICCPLAEWTHESGQDNKPSLSIKYGEGETSLYKCFACGSQGAVWQLLNHYAQFSGKAEAAVLADKLLTEDRPSLSSKFAILHEEEAYNFEPPPKVDYLHDMILDGFPPASMEPAAMEYLKSRGVEEVVDLYDIRYDVKNGRIVFPVRDQQERLQGAVGRAINSMPKYYNYFGFSASYSLGGIDLVKGNKVLIVEGFFDVLRARTLGYNAVCTWKAELSTPQADMVLGLDADLYLCFDGDAAGRKGTRKAMELLEDNVYSVKVCNPGDKDVGEMTKEELQEVLGGASRL